MCWNVHDYLHATFQVPTTNSSLVTAIKETSSNIHPVTGHEGPKREQRYSSSLSLTSALDKNGRPKSRPGRFTLSKETRYKFSCTNVKKFSHNSHNAVIIFKERAE
jgi:hypothetical protein